MEELRKITQKTPLGQVANVLAEIETQHLPNMSQEQ
jgi:hypothetical protein